MSGRDVGTKHRRAAQASSTAFDSKRLLAGRPEARRIAAAAEITAAVGELVRQLRTAKGVTQAELATKVGSTQAHISELERGLGRNGPTILTLARIISELGAQASFDEAMSVFKGLTTTSSPKDATRQQVEFARAPTR